MQASSAAKWSILLPRPPPPLLADDPYLATGEGRSLGRAIIDEGAGRSLIRSADDDDISMGS